MRKILLLLALFLLSPLMSVSAQVTNGAVQIAPVTLSQHTTAQDLFTGNFAHDLVVTIDENSTGCVWIFEKPDN